MSLRAQIAILTSVAVLTAYGIMFFITITSDREHTLEKSDTGLKILSLYMAGQLSNRFDNVSALADQLALRITDDPPSYSKQAFDLMEQYYGLNPDAFGGAISFDEFKFTARQRLYCLYIAKDEENQGFIQGRLGPDYDYLDPSQPKNSWFTVPKATGKSYWTLPFLDDGGGGIWMLTYAAPYTNGGVFWGTVNVDVALDAPSKWMTELVDATPSEVKESGYAFLTDASGVIVSHPDVNIAKQRYSVADILEYIDSPDLNGDNASQPLLVRQARTLLDPKRPIVRVSRSRVGNTGWYLYTSVEERRALADYYDRLYRSLIWMVVAVGLFLAVLTAFTRRMTAPLVQSAAFATRLRDGHLNERMAEPRQLECCRLVSALNDMAETLEKRTLENERAARIRENIFRRVAVAVDELTRIAMHIHAESAEGVRDANAQREDFRQFSDALGRFREQASRLADVAGRADHLLLDAQDRTEVGNKEMLELTGAMSDLVESSADIARILKIINDIAVQTNLLALNASVEAVRAGLHGRGFAVVADEVRSLASRSAKAANDTNQKLSESDMHAEHGLKVGARTTEAFEAIRKSTGDVATLVSEVSRLSQEQATMVDRISHALDRVGNIAEGNRIRSMSEADASNKLRETAELLREIILGKNTDEHAFEPADSRRVQQLPHYKNAPSDSR